MIHKNKNIEGGADNSKQYVVKISGDEVFQETKTHKKAKNADTDAWRYLSFVGEIGFSVVIPLAGGIWLGNIIDRRLDTYPIATMLGLVFGLILGVVSFVKIIRSIIR